jgi:hypothetical protein
LEPDGVIAFIATPFHQDDLMGHLLRQQANAWRVLRMPAIGEADDPLGRQEGEPLWSDDAAYGYGNRLVEPRDQHECEGLMRDWHSLYQCRPRPPEGAMFTPAEINRARPRSTDDMECPWNGRPYEATDHAHLDPRGNPRSR